MLVERLVQEITCKVRKFLRSDYTIRIKICFLWNQQQACTTTRAIHAVAGDHAAIVNERDRLNLPRVIGLDQGFERACSDEVSCISIRRTNLRDERSRSGSKRPDREPLIELIDCRVRFMPIEIERHADGNPCTIHPLANAVREPIQWHDRPKPVHCVPRESKHKRRAMLVVPVSLGPSDGDAVRTDAVCAVLHAARQCINDHMPRARRPRPCTAVRDVRLRKVRTRPAINPCIDLDARIALPYNVQALIKAVLSTR
jgi:hypothetical protein